MATFRDHLDAHGITQSQAAEELGETLTVVHRAYHRNHASTRLIAKIRDWSNGAVTFDDFFPPAKRADEGKETAA